MTVPITTISGCPQCLGSSLELILVAHTPPRQLIVGLETFRLCLICRRQNHPSIYPQTFFSTVHAAYLIDLVSLRVLIVIFPLCLGLGRRIFQDFLVESLGRKHRCPLTQET